MDIFRFSSYEQTSKKTVNVAPQSKSSLYRCAPRRSWFCRCLFCWLVCSVTQKVTDVFWWNIQGRWEIAQGTTDPILRNDRVHRLNPGVFFPLGDVVSFHILASNSTQTWSGSWWYSGSGHPECSNFAGCHKVVRHQMTLQTWTNSSLYPKLSCMSTNMM